MKTGIFLMALLFLIPLAGAQQLRPASYTPASASNIILNATQYVDEINQSSYLIFSPNLTQAYAYLNQAQAIYNKSPSSAVFYAEEAVAVANSQYAGISQYRYVSFLVEIGITIILALLLGFILSGSARKRKRIKRGK